MLIRPCRWCASPHPSIHYDWIFELKHDGFRALAHVEGHRCRLLSRRGHVFKNFALLAEEIAHSVRAQDAILDGEIVCLDADGRSNFHKLLFLRDWPFFFAFDLLAADGEDLRGLPLLERKRCLRAIMPSIESRLLHVDQIAARGTGLFRAACERDLEGVVGKSRHGRYESDGVTTSWVKIKNPHYSQMDGRRGLFEKRRDQTAHRSRSCRSPVLAICGRSTTRGGFLTTATAFGRRVKHVGPRCLQVGVRHDLT